jgi:hypothetical protein
MKRISILFSLLLMNLAINAQTNPPYIFRVDSLPVQSFKLASQGNLNIQQTRKTSYGRVEVLVMRGKRPVAVMNFGSVADLNQSNFSQRIRGTVQPGDRLIFELTPAKGSPLILNLKVE